MYVPSNECLDGEISNHMQLIALTFKCVLNRSLKSSSNVGDKVGLNFTRGCQVVDASERNRQSDTYLWTRPWSALIFFSKLFVSYTGKWHICCMSHFLASRPVSSAHAIAQLRMRGETVNRDSRLLRCCHRSPLAGGPAVPPAVKLKLEILSFFEVWSDVDGHNWRSKHM